MDRIAMSPPDAMPGIESVVAAGNDLAARTPGHVGGIVDAETGIGAGTLGQAFRGRHQQASSGVRSEADRLTGEFQEIGGAGLTAVTTYRAADAASAHEYGR